MNPREASRLEATNRLEVLVKRVLRKGVVASNGGGAGRVGNVRTVGGSECKLDWLWDSPSEGCEKPVGGGGGRGRWACEQMVSVNSDWKLRLWGTQSEAPGQ